MDPVSITALILAILSGLGAIISRLKFKHCHMGCIDSDCVRTPQNTPPDTPTRHKHIHLEDTSIYLNNITV